MIGGALTADDDLRFIESIGFEFETSKMTRITIKPVNTTVKLKGGEIDHIVDFEIRNEHENILVASETDFPEMKLIHDTSYDGANTILDQIGYAAEKQLILDNPLDFYLVVANSKRGSMHYTNVEILFTSRRVEQSNNVILVYLCKALMMLNQYFAGYEYENVFITDGLDYDPTLMHLMLMRKPGQSSYLVIKNNNTPDVNFRWSIQMTIGVDIANIQRVISKLYMRLSDRNTVNQIHEQLLSIYNVDSPNDSGFLYLIALHSQQKYHDHSKQLVAYAIRHKLRDIFDGTFTGASSDYFAEVTKNNEVELKSIVSPSVYVNMYNLMVAIITNAEHESDVTMFPYTNHKILVEIRNVTTQLSKQLNTNSLTLARLNTMCGTMADELRASAPARR
jgi:hypothetical protein